MVELLSLERYRWVKHTCDMCIVYQIVICLDDNGMQAVRLKVTAACIRANSRNVWNTVKNTPVQLKTNTVMWLVSKLSFN